MASLTGKVLSLQIDATSMTFTLLGATDPGQAVPVLKVYQDAPNTHTIPQLELARRSWMFAMLENAYQTKSQVTVTVGPGQVVTSLKQPSWLVTLPGGPGTPLPGGPGSPLDGLPQK